MRKNFNLTSVYYNDKLNVYLMLRDGVPAIVLHHESLAEDFDLFYSRIAKDKPYGSVWALELEAIMHHFPEKIMGWKQL